ncbi:uncharacterized protein MELLADRAFT_101863 [Melampsora larici-populina 98AG31]|uniref:Uncharacterized protein n=1 Tax=Melampsora larici-populina (strain 98AG31 / pathotype 3-4-7) TaxID=747676 RepID=F4R554_MELLP|nr:uncharacterized protein MELLADRAFT_101863 [Melampsora larici-populina 98AG31]EGG12326.1 hypothetical protein MELLADRAFT_101863 [Melampsora larici-populina 98AG31]
MPFQSKQVEEKDNSAWFDRLSPRDQSKLRPLKIGPMAHPLIHAGYDQCFDCGNFGHRRDRGDGCTSKVKKAPPFWTWRRVITGKDYSMSMLEMTPERLAKARNEVIAMEGTPEHIPVEYISSDFDVLTPWVFTEQDIARLDADESFTRLNNQPIAASRVNRRAWRLDKSKTRRKGGLRTMNPGSCTAAVEERYQIMFSLNSLELQGVSPRTISAIIAPWLAADMFHSGVDSVQDHE